MFSSPFLSSSVNLCFYLSLVHLIFSTLTPQILCLTSSINSRLSSSVSGIKKLRNKSTNVTSLVKPKFFVPTNLFINKEIKVYIFDQEVKRFTYTVDSKLEAPLTLTVTPCSDPIKWTFEFFEDSDAKELVSRKRRRHGKNSRQSHHQDRLRLKRHRHTVKQRQQLSNDSAISSQSNGLLLAKYNGIDRKSFTDIRRQYAGQYVIQLSSNKKATSATLILSHFVPYPLLPVNDGLTLISSTESSVTFRWEQSLSEPDYPIDYYTLINQDHKLISYCEYLEQTESLLKYPSSLSSKSTNLSTLITLPIKSSIDGVDDNVINFDEMENEVLGPMTTSPFVRWWERTMAANWESEQSRKNWTSLNIFNIEQVNKSHDYHHTFKLLQPSTRYYIDVIAVIRNTGRTSVYKGLNVTTKELPKRRSNLSSNLDANESKKSDSLLFSKLIKIRDKRLTSVALSKRNNFTEILSYSYNESDFNIGNGIWLFVQLCSPLPVTNNLMAVDVTLQTTDPSASSIIIKEKDITGSRVISVPMGYKWYNRSSFKGSINDQKTVIVSLVASGKQHYPLEVTLMMAKKRIHIPYPQLPRDRTIRVLDLLTTCKSVSLAWIASPDEKSRYCLYAASGNKKLPLSLIHRELNSLPGFNSTSLSTCDSFKSPLRGTKRRGSNKKSVASKQLRSVQRNGNLLEKSKYFKRILCRRFPRFTNSRLNQVIMQEVTDLSPETEYVFLVEIIKSKGLSAFYNPLTTSTKSTKMC